jgi:hypothetical protein
MKELLKAVVIATPIVPMFTSKYCGVRRAQAPSQNAWSIASAAASLSGAKICP